MEFPDFSLNTAILGTLIVGMGYLGLLIKNRLDGSDFKELKVFDKFVQSLILGTVTFVITLKLGVVTKVSQENIVDYIMNRPEFFIIQFFFIIISIFCLIAIDEYLYRISTKQHYQSQPFIKNI